MTKLVELPNGSWIDASVVVGIRPITNGDDIGRPRVVVDVTSACGVLVVYFDSPDVANSWAREFANDVNAARAEA